MALKSKKKLFEFLENLDPEHFEGLQGLGLDHPMIENETFGPKSMIFVQFPSLENRREAEDIMEDEGFAVFREYSPDYPRAEIQVSYFKGDRWWE